MKINGRLHNYPIYSSFVLASSNNEITDKDTEFGTGDRDSFKIFCHVKIDEQMQSFTKMLW